MSHNNIYELLCEKSSKIKIDFKVREIGVFGSFAGNYATDSSDVDILVEFENGFETFDNYMDLKFFLEDAYGRKVDLVMKDAIINSRIKTRILSEVKYA